MPQGILLTDDEVVALAALAQTPWPTGLFTVDATTDELRAAALRGVRALTVRGLLRPAVDGGSGGPDEALAAAVGAFLAPETRVGAYLAPMDDHRAMAGSSVTAVLAADQWWVDACTPDGIHAIRPATAGEARAAIRQFADGIASGDLGGAAVDPSRYGCVIRWGTVDDDAIVIASQGGEWDSSRLDEVLDGLVVMR